MTSAVTRAAFAKTHSTYALEDALQQAKAELEQISEIANKKSRQLDWLWANCRILHWPETSEYPFEHNPRANKDSREFIESVMNKELSK